MIDALYSDLKIFMFRAKLRKAVPAASVPLEIWRLMLAPGFAATETRTRGVGHLGAPRSAVVFRAAFERVLRCMIEVGQLPDQWQQGRAGFIAQRDKVGIVGIVDPVSKIMMKAVWELGFPPLFAKSSDMYSGGGGKKQFCLSFVFRAG